MSSIKKIWKNSLILITASLFTAACASSTPANPDPYESFNRHTYAFNKALDKAILKPIAVTYKRILPWPVTDGISNFFDNMDMITTIANDILQVKMRYIGLDTGRFVLNATVGIGGLFDVATRVGMPKHYEDFGLTLARWGYKNSTYIVLPLFGPSTFRDAVGMPVDFIVLSPYTLLPWHSPWWQIRYSLLGLYYIDHRAVLLDYDDLLNQAALDEYSFVRDAYLQHRQSLISGDSLGSDIYLSDATPNATKTTSTSQVGGNGNDDDIYIPDDTSDVTKTTKNTTATNTTTTTQKTTTQ